MDKQVPMFVDPASSSATRLDVQDVVELAKRGQLVERVTFKIHFLNGEISRGEASAAGAVWSCPCGQKLDIDSQHAFNVTGGVRLDCSSCERRYFLSQGVPLIAVNGVHEIGLS